MFLGELLRGRESVLLESSSERWRLLLKRVAQKEVS